MKSSRLTESLDIDRLRQWIGRAQQARDVVTPRLIAQLNACFDDPAVSALPATEAPSYPGLHWALAVDTPSLASLETDGHMARGTFLPPVPLPDRMWAGGRLEHLDPLRVGDTVECRSRIEDISIKQGRSGVLCFVSVRHEFITQRGPALSERQDIVYRDQGTGSTASIDRKTQTGDQDGAPTVSWTLNTGLPQLFRYSALTFNSHLIHYDRDYCRDQGYPDLLVHGPLQATLLLRLAASMHDGALPRVFSYRALRPLFVGMAFSVNAAPFNDALELWIAEDGGATMRAQAHW